MLIHADDTDNTDSENNGLIFEDLTYKIRGVLFSTHNELGCYAKEKQYSQVAARIFKERNIKFESEVRIGDLGNIADGIVEEKVLIELKAKRIVTKEDYYQTQRYLQETGLKLAILVNMRDKLIKPKRIIRIDNWKK